MRQQSGSMTSVRLLLWDVVFGRITVFAATEDVATLITCYYCFYHLVMPLKRATIGRTVRLGKASKKTPTPTRRLYSGGTGGDGGATAVLVYGTTAVMAVPRRSHCGLAQPAVALRWHCGSFEHVQSFRSATAKVRGFDSFPRCYGDQWRNHCGTTAIMAVPLQFMPYKHRSGTATAVWRGYDHEV